MTQSSPLFWGYDQPAIDVFKGNANVWTVAPEAEVLMRYATEPYRSGYVTPEQLAAIAGTPLVALQRKAAGRILYRVASRIVAWKDKSGFAFSVGFCSFATGATGSG